MTAKEAKKELIQTLYDYYVNRNAGAYKDLDNAWKTFETQLCREQREICAKTYNELPFQYSLNGKMVDYSIRNAPQPEL